jgi:phosphoribosylaminoimidazolecarboxamide formyltransferase/IMP cyclohydrolase
LKHNNACGLATRGTLAEAYADALAGDPVSAFGGVLIANRPVDEETAASVHELFCEVVIAPDFSPEALTALQGKKNRILLKWDLAAEMPSTSVRTALNGFLVQEMDTTTEGPDHMQQVTTAAASAEQLADCAFAMRIAKHTKSNTIVFAKNRQLLASGTGQTSRVDALKQAVVKAGAFGLSLEGAVMASDAFFPFPDCVELADQAGITAVVQPGGSIKDQDSIDYCDAHGLAMYTTGVRHFRH